MEILWTIAAIQVLGPFVFALLILLGSLVAQIFVRR